MLFRVGTGAMVFGYSPGIADDGPDAPTYPTYGRVFGKRIAESSQVASFPRPEQPPGHNCVLEHASPKKPGLQ